MTATPSAEMEVKLEPCRFCGGALARVCGGEAWFYVSCDDCAADGPVKATPQEAITAWNRPSSSIRREALEEAARKLELEASCLQDIHDDYSEAQHSGRYDGRKIPKDLAKRFAHAFGERADAVWQCAESLRALANDGRAEGET